MKQNKRNKPFYKQFLRLRKNIQDRPKLFKFKKQKWQNIQRYSKNQLKFYRRFQVKDQFQSSISKFASRGNSFQRKFRNNLYDRKLFSLFYGGLKRKYLKKHILKSIQTKEYRNGISDFRYQTLQFFESRLDTVLVRSKFCLSFKSAAQLILHGHILVNGNPITTKSYILKPNDLIEVALNSKSRQLVKNNLDRSNFWPLPPKHLAINYRTLQILFLYTENSNFVPVFNHYLNLNSIVANIKRS